MALFLAADCALRVDPVCRPSSAAPQLRSVLHAPRRSVRSVFSALAEHTSDAVVEESCD
jgi:hypothetical protein